MLPSVGQMAKIFRVNLRYFSKFSAVAKHFRDNLDMQECFQKTADARGKKLSEKTANCSNFREKSEIFTIFPGKNKIRDTKTQGTWLFQKTSKVFDFFLQATQVYEQCSFNFIFALFAINY